MVNHLTVEGRGFGLVILGRGRFGDLGWRGGKCGRSGLHIFRAGFDTAFPKAPLGPVVFDIAPAQADLAAKRVLWP